jgi:iron complex outermembrane recepter protein
LETCPTKPKPLTITFNPNSKMKQSLFSKQPLLRIMKITVTQCFLIALCSVMALARPAKAQQILTREVSVKMANVSLKTVLQEIEKQTNVHFVYSNNAVKANTNVSLQTSNEPLSSVLPKLLSPNLLRYEVVEEQIVLKKIKEQSSVISEEKESVSVIVEDKVSGKVTADKGEVLPGVSVLVKGTSKGTVTNNDGDFNIAAKVGDVLIFSFVGFAKQEVSVTDANQILKVTLKEDISQLGEVVVIGSRSTVARTNVERPVPVDVISAIYVSIVQFCEKWYQRRCQLC